jgi:hypothetical protein
MMRRLAKVALLLVLFWLLVTPVEALLEEIGYVVLGWILAVFGEIVGGSGYNNGPGSYWLSGEEESHALLVLPR